MKKLNIQDLKQIAGGKFGIIYDTQSCLQFGVSGDSVYVAGHYTFHSEYVTYKGESIFSGNTGGFYVHTNLCSVYGSPGNSVSPGGNMYTINIKRE